MINDQNLLVHYGIRGQQWGVRRFQNEDGSFTEAGKERYGRVTSKKSKVKSSNATKIETLKKDDKKLSEEINKKSDAAKKFLIGAGIVSLVAVGGYLAYKSKMGPKTVKDLMMQNNDLPETYPKKDNGSETRFRLKRQFETEIKPSLSSDEISALSDYTYSEYARRINHVLEADSDGNSPYRIKTDNKTMIAELQREGIREQTEKQIKLIDSAFEKAPVIDSEMIVNRKTRFSNMRGMFGGNMTGKELAEILENPEKAIGRTLAMKSYCSTSIDSKANSTFGNCNLHILLPKGTRGLYLESISGSPKEQEFLLPRNSSFRLVSVQKFDRDVESIYFSSMEIFLELIT